VERDCTLRVEVDRAAIALHYAAGEVSKTPARAYAAARAAADAALARFDNETAARLFALARAAAEEGGIDLDASFHRSLGEAHLRQGFFDAALRSFDEALAHVAAPEARADLRGRIAWVHLIRSDPERAWSSLAQAFESLGVSMPVESVRSVAHAVAQATTAKLSGFGARIGAVGVGTRAAREILCDLHYQNARLGVEHGKPLRLFQSAVEGIAASEPLGPSRAQARAHAIHAFASTVLGRRTAGRSELAAARELASKLGDPTTETFCLQLESVSACFRGDFDAALELLHECVEVRGHWLELSEYCHDATAAELIESLRGRSSRAWTWTARAIARLQRSYPVSSTFAEHFVYRAEAALAALGRDPRGDPWLSAQLAATPGRRSSHMLSWGPRARCFVERADFGPAFDALVAEFTAERHNPRLVHPMVVEYYIAVAHGRLEQCLAAPRDVRDLRIPPLRRALRDLTAAARVPLFRAHQLYIEGCLAWLDGRADKSRALLVEAEALAIRETAPWVLYAIARARAYALQDEGRPQAAHDQARIAEALAREHGSSPRARRVCEEFGLSVATSAIAASRSGRSSRASATNAAGRQLRALLHAIRAPLADLRPEMQGPAVLDDLMRAVEADWGLLSFEPEPETRAPLRAERDRRSGPVVSPDWPASVIPWVRETGTAWPPPDDVTDLVETPQIVARVDPSRALALPLFLHGKVVGAVCLERLSAKAAFSVDDRDLLRVLSYQVPISIELARLIAERDQLHASLQQAQKMEAVGHLAGSVAHDFAHMLAAVRGSMTVIEKHADAEVAAELDVILAATDRAGQLMRQLLDFSQERPVVASLSSINDLIVDLAPMLERLVGDGVALRLHLDPEVDVVNIERASFDQALVNLVVNARDAMPTGGEIAIATRTVRLDEAARRHGAPAVGENVVVEISDTGHGVSAEHLPRIFDPFFTTKPAGTGSGIGLTTTYAFVKRSGGHIEVTSSVGLGTTFRLHFPAALDLPVASEPAPVPAVTSMEGDEAEPESPPGAPDSATVLLVEDDGFLRAAVGRSLRKRGFDVLEAEDAESALRLAATFPGGIDVLLTDVVLPMARGPQLARHLVSARPGLRVLFMSGHGRETLPDDDARAPFIEKPFSEEWLVAKVRDVLQAAPRMWPGPAA